MFKYSKNSLEKLEGLHPKLKEFAMELIKISPYDFRINEGIRTLKKQHEYYTWGRSVFKTSWGEDITKPVTSIDGVRKKSKHQIQADGYGWAFDIAFMGKNQAETYSVVKFKALIEKARPLMEKYKIRWGGDFKNIVDMPHFELKE